MILMSVGSFSHVDKAAHLVNAASQFHHNVNYAIDGYALSGLGASDVA